MAPTVPAALTYSKEHLTQSNKLRKPMVEKMRRDRINSSIEQLKSLLGPFLQQQPDSKLEKADILEMAVFFLKRQQRQAAKSSSCSSPVSRGYSMCLQEINYFLAREKVMSQSRRKLLNHFQNLPCASDMSDSYDTSQTPLPHLKSPARLTTSKEETPVKGALWRPW